MILPRKFDNYGMNYMTTYDCRLRHPYNNSSHSLRRSPSVELVYFHLYQQIWTNEWINVRVYAYVRAHTHTKRI